ncbi:CDP-alcohol phosphatidyltransferase family protein [Desulfopila sp. IMCC35008]|uniref:CDP-alcohol phosphatidyltransferase family protein n=1 Tax=Desulfopila sp. IMCC35008 TaxID=2653858 RepID=UPI0013D24001|nr:CDP-alcohol phosphatidyltransferase family protein [Desulfopila sp. IMCC35008]
MLDRWTSQWLRPFLESGAGHLLRKGIRPDQVTVAGFVTGMLGAAAIAFGWHAVGLICILVNRCSDGLDGALARQSRASDAGGYLDIVLDFIFYSAVVFAFALADPEQNSLAAAALLFSFMGTGCSFLSFAIMAERRGLKNMKYPHKGFYYLGGLAEGTETILFMSAFCLFPLHFPALAWIFTGICLMTTVTRVIGGYRTIGADEHS